jgi:hypothetical protein
MFMVAWLAAGSGRFAVSAALVTPPPGGPLQWPPGSGQVAGEGKP